MATMTMTTATTATSEAVAPVAAAAAVPVLDCADTSPKYLLGRDQERGRCPEQGRLVAYLNDSLLWRQFDLRNDCVVLLIAPGGLLTD